MSSPFMAEYAETFDEPAWFDEGAPPLIERRTRNPQTGPHHAYDESRERAGATRKRAARAMYGAVPWAGMRWRSWTRWSFPREPSTARAMGIFERMANALVRVQDQDSGLWYQVMDCNGRQGNYVEASGSCMLTYALAKGIRLHYLAEIDIGVVERAYDGIQKHLITVDGEGSHLHGICHGAGLGGRKYRDGSYDYYLSEKVVSDSLMGVAPLLLVSIEMERRRRGKGGHRG